MVIIYNESTLKARIAKKKNHEDTGHVQEKLTHYIS